jgi:hypothetical protein
MLFSQIGDMNDAAFLRGPPGIALAQWLARVFDGLGVKTAPGDVFQRPGRGVEQKYVGCVNSRLDNDMGEQRCQT